jgi:hypothetical protein
LRKIKVLRAKEFSFELKKPGLESLLDVHRQGKPIHLTIHKDDEKVNLFDEVIPVGRMTRHVWGEINILFKKWKRLLLN